MKAIIMAGGEGTRLRPLTCDRPKPMVPVANRPVMEYAVDLLKKHGITQVGVTLQYLPDAITDYFGDGSQFGITMKYFVEEIPLGTAGSVKNAEEFLDDTFLVISGDALTDFNLTEAINFHREKKAVATLVLTSVENPLEYGVVITDCAGRITRFLEKPGWGEVFSDHVNTGIYILEPEVLQYFAKDQKFDFSRDLFPLLLKQRQPLYGCLLSSYWCDIGSIEQYQQAHMDILQGKVDVELSGTMLNPGIIVGKNVEISKSARIVGPVLLGDYCKVGPGAVIEPYTVMGQNAVVDEEASLKRSILWNNVYVGKRGAVRGAVIGNRVAIQANATVLEGVAVGDDTEIGQHAKLKPSVKIWPHKNIDEGAIVQDSLVWGTKTNKNLFGSQGIPGLVNWDITPELAAKLGAAYGTVFDAKTKVAVSADGLPVTQMLKGAFISGLQSTGVMVYDLGTLTAPINRFAVRSLGVAGGVHFKIDPQEKDQCWIQFINNKGVNLNRVEERKLEGVYWREDFRRVKQEKVGQLEYIPRFVESYGDNLVNLLDVDSIRENKFSLVIHPRGKVVSDLLQNVLDRLGCNVVPFNEKLGTDIRLAREPQDLDKLARQVVEQHAHLGVGIDGNGEQLVLVDDRGRVIDEQLFAALMAVIIFKANNGGALAVPVSAPGIIEQIAEQYGGTVIRTKTLPSAIMEQALSQEVVSTQKNCSQFFFQYDALYALGKVLEFLSLEKQSLSQVVGAIPPFHLKVKSTQCPWEAKGRVMRTLIAQQNGMQAEMIDGLKVWHDHGWVLILPHADKPLYNVFSESVSHEAAEELSNLYVNKIREILANET